MRASLRDYQEELLKERDRQARIKEKYGIRSLAKLIEDHDADLTRLRAKQRDGANVDIAIHNKAERQRQYIDSKRRLADLIEREKSLTISMPTFLGIVRVVPSSTISDAMKENSESEKAAMDAAMAFEREQGREPMDVSRKIGLGYDIKSEGKGETRYIEVKGRHGEGGISITHNEWFRANQLENDYYLYVVWNTKTNSAKDMDIYRIKNPARLSPKVDIHYIISAEEIRKAA